MNININRQGRILFLLLCMVSLACSTYAQTIKTYKAKRNDTMEKIAEKYGISLSTLLHYNSTYKDTPLRKGNIIIIPEKDEIPEAPSSPSAPYATQTVIKEIDFSNAEFIEHTVLPKETKYGISRRYGITQDDLTRLNPVLQTQGLQIGMVLKIPVLTPEQKNQSSQNIALIENMPSTDAPGTYHVVRPKETKYGISRMYGITEEQLCVMNPHLRTEMPRIGETLRIPKPIPVVVEKTHEEGIGTTADTVVVDTIPVGKYSHLPQLKLDVILPFYADKADTMDYIPAKDRLKDSRTAITFYSGILMALDSLGKDGLKIQARVFDSNKDIASVSGIVSYNDFSQTDIVIGPLFAEMAEFAVKSLKNTSPALVVSPLSMRHDVAQTPHLVQSTSSQESGKETMADYMVENIPYKSKVLLITSEKMAEDAEYLKTRIISRVGMGNVQTLDVAADSVSHTMAEKILGGYTTIITPTICAEVMNPLMAAMDMAETGLPKVTVYALDTDTRGKRALAAISGTKAGAMTFIYTSRYFEDKTHEGYADFVTAYRARFHEYPSSYAVQGFDVTYDMINRWIQSTEAGTSEVMGTASSQGIGGRYTYRKHENGGHENTAVYIVSYKKSEGETLLQ